MLGFKRRKSMREHSVVFIPRTSRLAKTFKVVAVIGLILAAPVSAWLGWEAALLSQQAVSVERDRLAMEREVLGADLDAARQRYQQLEVDLLVAHEAQAEGRGLVQELEQQLFRVQQDLAQYQGALAPNAMLPGLRIQAFELQAADSPNTFRYKVMVSRVGSESDTVEARLKIQVHGQQDGEARSISLADLVRGGEGELDEGLELNFRYFQVVPSNGQASELTLPAGFEPERVLLEAVQDGEVLVEQSFDWTLTGARP